jgi:hypothetical protein
MTPDTYDRATTSSATRARMEQAFGPARDDDPPVYPGPLVLLRLTRTGPMPQGVSVAQALRAVGVTLREAHAVVAELREVSAAPVRIAAGVGLEALQGKLRVLGVSASWCICARGSER